MRRMATVALVVVASGFGGWFAQSATGAAGAGPRPEGYTPRGQPTRILDTRTTGIVGGGQTVQVSTQQAGVQAAGVNIALTETSGSLFVSAWDCNGARPNTAVINSSGPGENISNFVIVPVNSGGVFCLFTNSPTHIVVDLMGTFTPDAGGGGSPSFPASPGLAAQITGYSPGSSITSISGLASNNSGATRSFRVDIQCPNGTVETDSLFSVPNGETRGFDVICGGGGFSSGAAVKQVVQI